VRRENDYKANLKVQRIAIAAGIFLLGLKFSAYWLTNSNAILTDALESIVNVAASFMGLYSLNLSATPRDKNHPYGHGKVEFISGMAEGLMILVAAVIIIIKAVKGFIVPNQIENLDIGLYLILFSGIVNYAVGAMAERQGEKADSMTLIAGGKHLKTDAYTTAGLVIGIVLILITGLNWVDNAVALLFGILILTSAWKILRKSAAGVMDEADFDALERLANSLEKNRIPEWIDIHNLRLVKYGPDPHIDCHLTLPFYKDLRFANEQLEKLNTIVNEILNAETEMFVHTDPCVPAQCKICKVVECQARNADFKQQLPWDLDNLLEDRHHEMV
jgi:cation diffusion facilitator family transporter